MSSPVLRQLGFLLLVYSAMGYLVNSFKYPLTNSLTDQNHTPALPKRYGTRYPCKTDTHCLKDWGLENTKCKLNKAPLQDNEGQICHCDENYVGKYDKNYTLYCFPIPQKLGDPCDIDEQCQYHIKNAVCLEDGKCGCKEGTVPDSYSGQCFMELYGLGECGSNNFSRSVNCKITAPGSICNGTTKRCQCPEGSYFLRSIGSCISTDKALKIGDVCGEMVDTTCSLIDGVICHQGIGQCGCMTVSREAFYYGAKIPMKCIQEGYNTDGFVRSRINQKWFIPIRNVVNQSCMESVHCTKRSDNNGQPDLNGECIDGRCVFPSVVTSPPEHSRDSVTQDDKPDDHNHEHHPSEMDWEGEIQYLVFFTTAALVLVILLLIYICLVIWRKYLISKKSYMLDLQHKVYTENQQDPIYHISGSVAKDNAQL